MAKRDPRKSEVRRLQMTGGSSFIVSLPKRWVIEHGLVAKDQVRVEWRPSGNLRIIPETSPIIRRREVKIELDNLPEKLAIDHLIAAYLSGANLIRVYRQNGFNAADRKLLRRFISIGRGIEIVNETNRIIEIESLVNAGSFPIVSSLNRMYLLIRTVLKDIVESLTSRDPIFLEDINDREDEVDALRLLIERQIGEILESAYLEDSAGINRWEAAELGNLVRTFERIGDHVYALGILAQDTEKASLIDVQELPFCLITSWLTDFKALNSNIKRPNLHEIHDAKIHLREKMKTLSNFEDKLWSQEDTVNALYLHRCSESIRRLCAYASDMAEILLNIYTHKNSRMIILE